ncbi:MAG: PAS domain S-box protein [Halobacteriales archaeon]|nr:PAS domain S-box protein [Halobacteriales archaeon]
MLCVDDEEAFVDLMATFLERYDDQLSVTTASSGAVGLELLHELNGEIDCIVSDYDMPEMDGLEFLAAVQSSFPTKPFILFTGRGSEEVASEAISAGVADYMQKGGGTDQYAVLAQRVRHAVQRERARLRVAEAEERIDTILEASSDAVLVCIDTDIIYANPAAVDLVQATGRDDLVGRSILDLVHRDDRSRLNEVIEPVQSGREKITRWPLEGMTLAGDRVSLELTGRKITWEGADGVVLVVQDITPMEDSRRRQLRYRAVFENAFDAVVIADDEGRFIDVNEGACSLFGLSETELLGRTIPEFAPEDFDFEAAWGQFQRSNTERGTFPLVNAAGEQFTVEYAATTDIVEGEHLSILRDVTDMAQEERELQQENLQLDEFARVVSHDLRNPLNTVRGYVELAREEGDPAYFERIERGLDRMERIIEDVLALARLGQDIGSTEAVDVSTTIEDAWDIVVGDETTASLEIDDHLPERMVADVDRLSQLLENLFDNAIKHGGDEVSVRVVAIDGGFAIEDDGPGIPEGKRDTIFERGFSTEEKGIGFGLYLARKIAEGHGWTITVGESETGGARFELSGIELTG